MQMKSVSKVQFGRLIEKWFYFSNGIMLLPYGNPSLENLGKEKQKHRPIHIKNTRKEIQIFKRRV